MKRIEEEIKQKSFKNEYQKLVINIFFTNNWLQEKHSSIFKAFDLTPQQYNILRILRGQHPNPSTINLLIERMLNKMCDASRLVEKLRVKKLVERVTCPEDRRAVNVVITEKGLELLKAIDPQLEKTYEEFAKRISETEASEANSILDKLRQ